MSRVDLLVISNLNSTSITERSMRRVIPTLVSIPGVHVTAHFTQYKGHAQELAAQAKKDGRDVVVVIGGDGTVNEAINGLVDAEATRGAESDTASDTEHMPLLGVVPTGSANVFARALGFSATPRHAVEQLAEAIKQRSVRRVALGTWKVPESAEGKRRLFVVNAGFGLDADVIRYMEEYRSDGSAATPVQYMIASLKMWAQLLRYPPKIAVSAHNSSDSLELTDMPVVFVSHSDPWTYLGPFPVRTNPGCGFDDGLGLYALRNTVGVRPLLAIMSVLFPSLRKVSASQFVSFAGASSARLALKHSDSGDDPIRGFQVDGEYVDLEEYGGDPEHPQVELGVYPEGIELLAPVAVPTRRFRRHR